MKQLACRRILPLFVLMNVLLAALPLSAYADVVYWTNTRDLEGRLIWTQPAYTPIGVVGSNLAVPDPDNPGATKVSPLQNPKDLFIDAKDRIYVADTDNNRIVEFAPDGKWVRFITIPESPLNKPEGVFVTDSQDIYIADTGNKRVLRLNKDGQLVKEFLRPPSRFVPASFKYDPTRIVVDKRGFLYIAVRGGYQGLLQLDPEGNFQSFYGANRTPFSALDAIKRALYTKEMYANEMSKLPGSISSVAMDDEGFIYTTTMGDGIKKDQIKKLNIRGLNMLQSRTGTFGELRWWDANYSPDGSLMQPALGDLTIDGNGNITAIDSAYKYINQYDANGNLLFFWAGPSSTSTTQLGLMKSPVAIDANSRNDLYILDGQDGIIQVFRLTEFGALVNEANRLTLQGRYEESERPWREVLRLNVNFTPATIGLAKAAYKQGDYERAAQLFQEGNDPQGYSNAFWQLRLVWFQTRFPAIATVLLTFFIGWALLERWSRNTRLRAAWRNRPRSGKSYAVQFRHLFHLLRHPIDGFTAVRYESKGSYWSALAVLAAAYAALVFSKMFTGFTFNRTDLHNFNMLVLLLQSALVWFGWVISNYLVSSIYRGEGRFKDVFIGSAYALLPIVLVGVPLAAISNVMTASELAIYKFVQDGMYVWIGLLVFWKVQANQNYSVGETAVNLILTIVTSLTLALLILVIMGLSSDLKDFVYEIYQEVKLR